MFGKVMRLAQGHKLATQWSSDSTPQASSLLISVIRQSHESHAAAGEGGTVGVRHPGTRPRVLEGAFLGELARTWARLEGARRGVTLSPAQTLGSRDSYCCHYLAGHSKVRQEQLPSSTPGRRQDIGPSPLIFTVASGSGGCVAPPWGDLDSICQKGPVSCRGAGQCTPRRQSVSPVRTGPTQLPVRRRSRAGEDVCECA